jgi:hypothetical protein
LARTGPKVRIPAPEGFYGCTHCGKVKPLADFPTQRNGPKGHGSWCKPCKVAAARASIGREDPTIAERLWAKVDRSGGPDACWLFTSPAERKGYGVILYRGKVCYAHRVSWLLAGRELTEGLQIDHLCNVPKCVNPRHLRLATAAQNVHRSTSKPAINRLKTHCGVCGTEFSPFNTAYKEQWAGKTRHGKPRGSPTRMRICITCVPAAWRYAVAKRERPANARKKGDWVGPQYAPKQRPT